MKPCPECGEPPHYHSFCTLCAQLFRVKPEPEPEKRTASEAQFARWKPKVEAMQRAIRAAHADGLTAKQAMERVGCGEVTLRKWKHFLGLPDFFRKSWGRPRRALDV